MSKSAQRTNPQLWSRIVAELKASNDGAWNARLAQRAVKIYKDRGGRYVGPKRADNSLAVWTAEDWSYVDGDQSGRYLPRGVHSKLTPAERRQTNARKRRATSQGRQRAAWSRKTAKLVKSNRARITRRSRSRRSRSRSSRSQGRRSRSRKSRK